MKMPKVKPAYVVGALVVVGAWWWWWRKPAASSPTPKASRSRKTDSGGGAVGASAGVPAEQLMSVDYGAELLMSIEPSGNGPV